MKAPRVFLGIVLFAVVAWVAVTMCLETVPIARVGVKQVLWGGTGVVQEDYATGFHVGITGLHKWHFLDARTHFLTFGSEGANTHNQVASASPAQLYPSLELRTKDNNMLDIDATVTYRIIPGEAHLLVAEAKHTVYRDRVVQVVEKALRTSVPSPKTIPTITAAMAATMRPYSTADAPRSRPLRMTSRMYVSIGMTIPSWVWAEAS